MQINQIASKLKAVFSEASLQTLAQNTQFQQRKRQLTALSLIKACLITLSKHQDANLSDIHRTLCAETGVNIDYKPFHNQIRKPQLTVMLKSLAEKAMAELCFQLLDNKLFLKRGIKRILTQDGSSFALHPALENVFPGRFSKISPAALEVHATYNMLTEQACQIDIRPDVEAERNFLPGSHTLADTLLLGDAGYFDLEYIQQIHEEGGFALMRTNNTINPVVLSAFRAGKDLKQQGIKLKEVIKRYGSQPLEMWVKWPPRSNKPATQLRLIYVPNGKRAVYLVTNLKEKQFTFDEILDIYSARWQIE